MTTATTYNIYLEITKYYKSINNNKYIFRRFINAIIIIIKLYK